MSRTTVTIAPAMYRRLKHLAVDRGVAVRELIRRAIDEYVKRQTGGRQS